MANHTHGGYGHDHDGGELPHDHDNAPPWEGEASEGTQPEPSTSPAGVAPEVVEQAIEAVQETAEHAIDALVEVHEQEEETERAEVMADAIEAIAEAGGRAGA